MLQLICAFTIVLYTSAALDVNVNNDGITMKMLDDFRHQLDMTSVDIMSNIYSKKNLRAKRDTEQHTQRNHIENTNESQHRHRSRRSNVVLDMVKAAKRTGNREELDLKSSIPVDKLQPVYETTDIVPIDIHLPTSLKNGGIRLFAVANHRNATGGYESTVVILRYNESSEEYSIHQTIQEYAPFEIEAFHGAVNPVLHKHFLAVAGYVDDVSSHYPTKVSVYELGPEPDFQFIKIQELRYTHVRALKCIEIMQTTYLFIGTYFQDHQMAGSKYSSPSQIMMMRFDPASNMFHFHSSLPASGAVDIECFTARRNTYLVVANYRDDSGSLDIFSYIYLYNEQLRGFELRQYISTHGARDIEHFVLANEDYIVIANEAYGTVTNKSLGVYSDVYKIANSKFELVQSLETYGAVKWKNLPIPNCKHDILLVYGDQRNNIDQVGIYSFSHDQESFRAVPFSIYHLDILNNTYRPTPLTMAVFSAQNFDGGEYSLYLIVGANDNTTKNNVYRLSYSIVLTASPLDAFTEKVKRQIKALNESINEVRRLLGEAKNTLADAVTKEGEQKITGKKIFQYLFATSADIDTVNITEGTLLFLHGNATHRANPDSSPHTPLADLESHISRHQNTISGVLNNLDTLMYVDLSQNVSAAMFFSSIIASEVNAVDVTLLSDRINDVNVTQLVNDVVVKNMNAVLSGKTFNAQIIVNGNLSVNQSINGFRFTDLIINGTNQTILATKVFSNHVKTQGNLTSGTINGFDFNKAIEISKPTLIKGPTTFKNDVLSQVVTSQTNINNLTLNQLFSDAVSKTKEQNITGHKTFTAALSNKDVQVGLVSGLNITTLKQLASQSSNSSIIHGSKIFESNVTIEGDLTAEQLMNDLNFPKDVVLKYTDGNITGIKTFANNVLVTRNVVSSGNVDGISLDTVVTLHTPQILSGGKTFNKSLNIVGNVFLPEDVTVNRVDISEFAVKILTSSGYQEFSDLTFQDDVMVFKSTIKNLVNNDSIDDLKNLYESSLHVEGNQDITGVKTLTSNVTVVNNLDAVLINSLNFPDEFAHINSNQTFTANKTFINDVHFTELDVGTTVNAIDIINLAEIIVFKGGDAIPTITGKKNFSGNVIINGHLHINGAVNNIKLASNLLLIDTEQIITGKKLFSSLLFPNLHVTAMKNVKVQTTIDGVDLSELDNSGMTVSKNETVTGTICFEQTDYNRSVDYINGVDLSALRDDIVTLNTEQVITSEKSFEYFTLKGNLNTTSTIDCIDVSDLYDNAVLRNKEVNIVGNVTLTSNITFHNDLTVGLLDDVDITQIEELLILKSSNRSLKNLAIIGAVTVDTLSVDNVNGLNVSNDIIFKEIDQNIDGNIEFFNITVNDVLAKGLVSGVNLTIFRNEVIFIDRNEIIFGNKTFFNELVINGNITTSGNVNGYDLLNMNVAKKSGITSQVITGTKTLVDSSSLHHLVAEKVNNKNITELFDNAVRLDRNEDIHGHINFENGFKVNNCTLNGDLNINGVCNGFNITEFDVSVLKSIGVQDMVSKRIENIVTVSTLVVNGSVNNLNSHTDLVFKDTTQNIAGKKTFTKLHLLGDLVTSNLVNGVNVTDVFTNTLMVNSTTKQVVTGSKFFSEVTLADITTEGYVDGIIIDQSHFVTLDTVQNIYGNKTFVKDFVSLKLDVEGKVANVNLSTFNSTRVLMQGDQIIDTDVTFQNDMNVEKDILISGLVNGIDLSSFREESPPLTGDLDSLENSLSDTLSKQCASLTYVKNSLAASPFRLDYFVLNQSLTSDNVHHTEYFHLEGRGYLALSIRTENLCQQSVIMKLNQTGGFVQHQIVQTSQAAKMKFIQSRWNESYLLVLNSKDSCSTVQGPSQILKWNVVLQRFEPHLTLQTMDAIDVDVTQENDSIFIFVANANKSFDVYKLEQLLFQMVSSNPSLSFAVHGFHAGNFNYIAVATQENTYSSRGYVQIKLHINSTLESVQSIAARGPMTISSFVANEYVYLVVGNDRDFTEGGHSTYDVTVDVFVQSKTTLLFEWFQSIPSYRTNHVFTYQVGSSIYLTIVHYGRSISIFRFGYELGFEKVDEIMIEGVRKVVHFLMESDHYMSTSVVINRLVQNSQTSAIYKLNPIGADSHKVEAADSC